MTSRFAYFAVAITSMLAALASWVSVYYGHPLLAMPPDLFGLTQPSSEQLVRITAHLRLNDTLALMIFSGLVIVSGVPFYTQGLSWPLKLVAAVAGIAIGVGAGWLMGLVGFYCYDWLPITWDVLVRVLVRLAIMLLPVALVAALVTVLLQRQMRKLGSLVLAALIGSVGTALVYTLITATLLPHANADAVLPHSEVCRFLLFALAPLTIWSTIIHQFYAGVVAQSTTSAELKAA